MKVLYGVLAAVFLLFAYFQWNDADSLVWILLYTLVAVLFGMALMDKFYRPVLLGSMGLIVIWMATLFPDFIKWLQDGATSITGSMKAESPHIELVREFLGLFLSFLAVLLLVVKSRKKIEKPSDLV